MDDIFSDISDEQNKDDANIEWKKSGIDKHERLTLKINVREANLYQARKANDLKAKTKAGPKQGVPNGFKKVSKKIRDALDDEEEDENDYILVPLFEDMNETSLLRALTDEEKKILQQNENINNVRLQENIDREAAVEKAEKVIMQAGLRPKNNRVFDAERVKSGKVTVEEVVAETVKQKGLQQDKKQTEARKRIAAGNVALRKDKDAARAAKKLNEAVAAVEKQAAAAEALRQKEEKTVKKDDSSANVEPQNMKADEKIKEELSSIKEDEKAAVERKEPEISSVREEKEPSPETAQPTAADEAAREEPAKTTEEQAAASEKEPEKLPEPEKEARDVLVREEQSRQLNEKIVDNDAHRAVRDEKEEKRENQIETAGKEKTAADREEPTNETGENTDAEMKNLILEKSGRAKSNRRQSYSAGGTTLSEKEYQQALDEKIRHYQDRER